MPLVHKSEVYADHGTFVLAPHREMGFEFPTLVTDDDVGIGYRIFESGLVIYTPDLDDFSIDVEVYIGSEGDEDPAPEVEFSTSLAIESVSLSACGLLERMADKPVFTIAPGTYDVSAKGIFLAIEISISFF